MTNKEKANLVIDLLIKYFETYLPDYESFTLLYNYNEETDVQYWDEYDWCEEFSFTIGNDKCVLDIRPYRIDCVHVNDSNRVSTLIIFNEVLEKIEETKNPSWDFTIEYLQKRLEKKDK